MVMEKAREISGECLVQKNSMVKKIKILHIPVPRKCEIKRVAIVANGGVSPHLQARYRDQRRKLGREGRGPLGQWGYQHIC